jgi:tRNA wybutosine-synthesizing protein 1
VENPISQYLIQGLKKQKYHMVGNHSAVKKCKWLHESLVHDRPCYKQKFYGIRSHRCLQMSPSLFSCSQQCLFCWRAQSGDLQLAWDEMKSLKWDTAEDIVYGSLKAQDAILSGYNGNPKVNWRKLTEARSPRHVAISLTGEPTLYGPLPELIRAFHNKGFTTFLVTNGTMPSVLSALTEEPSQLYVSLCAPNEKDYERICRPHFPEAWEKLNETLSFLDSFECPTVIRMTLVKEYNMTSLEDYARLIEKADPTYIEAKAYMHIGFSTLRLSFASMPEHREVYAFAEQLSALTGYRIIDDSPDSRVVLLSKRKKPLRFDAF